MIAAASFPILAVRCNWCAPSGSRRRRSQEGVVFQWWTTWCSCTPRPQHLEKNKKELLHGRINCYWKDRFWVRKNTTVCVCALESPEITSFCVWVTCQRVNGAITPALITSHWRERKLKAMLLLPPAESAVAEYYLGEFDVLWCVCFGLGFFLMITLTCSRIQVFLPITWKMVKLQ